MKGQTIVRWLVVALAALIGGGTAASAQAPPRTAWVDSFSVDKKDLVPAGSNAFFRLEPGYTLVLAKGDERLVVTVLEETRLIDGVETRVVEERESKGGRLVEISRNFYAFNAADRGVYYFGEEVDIYKGGRVVGHEGAWQSGRNGARFGLMMPDKPELGARFYQEIAPGVAMDRAEIVSLEATLKTPAGEFKGCLKVAETNPLESGGKEYKLYAPGIGLIKDGPLLLVEHGPGEKTAAKAPRARPRRASMERAVFLLKTNLVGDPKMGSPI